MSFNYTVKEGDTLPKIASKLKTNVDTLVLDNGIKNRDFVQVGQVLTTEIGDDDTGQKDLYESADAAASAVTDSVNEESSVTTETEKRSGVEDEQVEARSLLGKIQGPSQLAVGFYELLRSSFEGDHGSIPKPTNDSTEGNVSEGKRSLDIGYGHKLKKSELDSGTIYGIPFQNLKTGEYIPLTDSEKRKIQKKDIEANVNLARKTGWDSTLKSIGMSYESLSEPHRLVLSDLAYNVGGKTAGSEWKGIFSAMKAGNTKQIVGHLRRKDNEKNTPGMDNRAAKAAYAAGLIKTLQEAKDAGLVLANTKEIPLR